MQPKTMEVDPNRVIGKLQQQITELTMRNAVLEAALDHKDEAISMLANERHPWRYTATVDGVTTVLSKEKAEEMRDVINAEYQRKERENEGLKAQTTDKETSE